MKTIMNDEAFLDKGYIISTDKNLIDFDTVYHYLDTRIILGQRSYR